MKTCTFLIKSMDNREAVMRLPVKRNDGITTKGFKLIGERFYNGTTKEKGQLKYAVNLEAYSNARNLIEALTNYQKNII